MRLPAGIKKYDWQTWVAAGALLMMVVGIARSVMVGSAREELPASAVPHPPQQTQPLVVQRLSSSSLENSDGKFGPSRSTVLRPGETRWPPVKPSPEVSRKLGEVAFQQLDYETFKKIQTKEINSLRQHIREHGVGPDGVTEADLDRMLKNDQIPQ